MSRPRLLVVHEDAVILGGLQAALQSAGNDCDVASKGESAFEAIDRRLPDVVLLSLDLPGGGGTDLCAHIRTMTGTPVIALSANGSDASKIAALDAGADDYMTLPLSMPEVLARVRVALRHRRELAAVSPPDGVLHVGTLRIDPDGHAAAIGTRVLQLTPKEFELLGLLARSPDRVLTHQVILEAIWPGSRSHDSLRLHISQLRKKLASDAGAPTVVTVPGVGYRLEA